MKYSLKNLMHCMLSDALYVIEEHPEVKRLNITFHIEEKGQRKMYYARVRLPEKEIRISEKTTTNYGKEDKPRGRKLENKDFDPDYDSIG